MQNTKNIFDIKRLLFRNKQKIHNINNVHFQIVKMVNYELKPA